MRGTSMSKGPRPRWVSGLAFVVFLSSFSLVGGKQTKTCAMHHRSRTPGFCGDELTDILHLICQQFNKRSGPPIAGTCTFLLYPFLIHLDKY